MRIVVCAKIINGEINPFDACALECALQIDNADITLLTMGAKSTEDELSRLSRLDISKVVLLSDIRLSGSDTLATSYALSYAIKKLNADLVFCGRQSIDGDTSQVGPCLSQMLGFNLITNILKINNIDKSVSCKTRLGDEQVNLPAVLTVERINNLRFPRILSQTKEIEKWSVDNIGVDPKKCGLKGSPTKVLQTFESNIGKRKCKFITFEQLDDVINNAVIANNLPKEEVENSGLKLKSATIIGNNLLNIAKKIADNVKVINSADANEISELIKDDAVVLWQADLWGRRIAPVVAAKLNTGLCADCTKLETDGEKLFMYRPAFSGTLTAKIECRTTPQMATVRIQSDINRSNVILGIGRGAVDDKEKYIKLFQKYNVEIAASRAVVDMNALPYENQVGLTGKNINPKVYIACGISGAVQHTCGFERANTVIAINPDKNARIFEFCDYGIVGKL